ncbi:MAG: hypothetical protein AAB316_08070 [Bacteroidota bacterium]
MLLNEGKMSFKPLLAEASGFHVSGDAKAVAKLALGKSQTLILVAKNSGKMKSFATGNEFRR